LKNYLESFEKINKHLKKKTPGKSQKILKVKALKTAGNPAHNIYKTLNSLALLLS